MAFSLNPYRYASQRVPPVTGVPSYQAATLTSLPPNFTFTRSGGGTYSSWNGAKNVLVSAAASNAPRFEYKGATPLGLKKEGYCKNYCTNFNANPLDLTGIVQGGDSAAQLSVETDNAGLLGNAVYDYGNSIDLTGVCTAGRLLKLDNTAGSGPAYIEFVGSPDSLSNFTASIYALATAAGAFISYGASVALGTTIIPVAATLARYQLSFTPDDTAKNMRVTVPAGCVVHLILNQLEQNNFASSVIIVAGAVAQRNNEGLYDAAIATRSYYNAAAGAIMAELDFDSTIFQGNTHTVILANGTGLTDVMDCYINAGRSRIRTRTAVGGTYQTLGLCNNAGLYGNSNQSDLSSLDSAQATFHSGFTWTAGTASTPGSCILVNGCVDTTAQVLSGPFTNPLNRLDIGGRPFSEFMFGHVRSIKIWNVQPDIPTLGFYMNFAGAVAIGIIGQSNGSYPDGADAGNSGTQNGFNDGEKTYISQMVQAYPAASRCYLMHLAAGSAAYDGVGPGSFYDCTSGTFQPLYTQRASPMMQAFLNGGGTLAAVGDNQGESNVTATQANIIKPRAAIIGDIRTNIVQNPDLWYLLECIGRREDSTAAGSDAGYQNYRQTQQLIAQTFHNCVLMPERVIQPMGGNPVHLTNAGYAGDAPLRARKGMKTIGRAISGPVDGGVFTAATRNGSSGTAQITMPAGMTALTPSSGNAANSPFRFFDQAALPGAGSSPTHEIQVASWQVTGYTGQVANIAYTLASAPTITGTNGGLLYYIYGTCYKGGVIDPTTFLRGNDQYQIPVRAAFMALPYSSTAPGDFDPNDFNSSDFQTGTTTGDFTATDFNQTDFNAT